MQYCGEVTTIGRNGNENLLIRIGTRQSPLARWQSDHIASELKSLGIDVEIVPIVTAGDVSTRPLGESGGVGLFTKEIQRALLDRRCDVAVHSLKDLPTEPVEGLTLAAVPLREDVRDCLIGRTGKLISELPVSATIGSGSLRRAAQLKSLRPDLQVIDIRGNVDTRLNKLDKGDYDAIVLAAAGLHRLKLDHRVTQRFTIDEMLPAVGQAALGLETRVDDCGVIDVLERISHLATHQAVIAERSLLRSLRAGCLAPVAALATIIQSAATEKQVTDTSNSDTNAMDKNNGAHLEQAWVLQLRARVLSLDGITCIETTVTGNPDHAVAIGKQAAKELEEKGAQDLMAAARK